ncbi:MAG: histidinol dehydrogenase [Treponema sp.]|jgi:histidinol dehydrogenase|nr:histidinol dehydrogenase [Treponema sp.]
MRIIDSAEFDAYWRNLEVHAEDEVVNSAIREVIAAVRKGGDKAVREFAARFDKNAPERAETPPETVKAAYQALQDTEPELTASLELAARNIRTFAEYQRDQFRDFEFEIAPGVFTGQRVIPVERAAIYAPGGRFPLVSTVLMGVIPAIAAGVEEVILASPPQADGLPDRRILAAAYLAGARRVFAIGGAQAIAALALGTETIPQVDVIAGPGNKYVAAAKRLLFGEVGIDFIAGPTDVLVIADGRDPYFQGTMGPRPGPEDLVAADLLAQAEHDPDARARTLVPGRDMANRIMAAVEKQLAALPSAETAQASLDAGGLIIVYQSREEAIRIANTIAPEHLELQVEDPNLWVPRLRNYGSLFVGAGAAEALGDYSAGINHTLPTSGSARFSAGLSVRHFLKTPTSLRCGPGPGFDAVRLAAERIARSEGLAGHEASAAARA